MNNNEVKELEDFIDRRIGESDRREPSIIERWSTPAAFSLLVGVIVWAITLQAAVKEHEGKIELLAAFDQKAEERYDSASLQMERVVLLLDQIERRLNKEEIKLTDHVKHDSHWQQRIITLEQKGK